MFYLYFCNFIILIAAKPYNSKSVFYSLSSRNIFFQSTLLFRHRRIIVGKFKSLRMLSKEFLLF